MYILVWLLPSFYTRAFYKPKYNYLYGYKLNPTSFLEMIMNDELDDTDYEDMDDLALPDHIEWNHAQSQNFSMDAMDDLYGY